jgi:hypothetical protein
MDCDLNLLDELANEITYFLIECKNRLGRIGNLVKKMKNPKIVSLYKYTTNYI